MMNGSQADAGPQTEIAVGTELDLRILLFLIIPLSLMVPVHFLIGGITDTVYISLFEFAVVLFVFLGCRYAESRRVLFDREGMTFLARGIGRLRAPPFHFRWDEVAEIRPAMLGTMRLRLNRPRKFWTFRSQPKNSIWVPKRIRTEPQFAEALRTFVPAERIRAELAFDERLSWSARYGWTLAPVMLLCAAAAAGCGLVAFRSAEFMGFLARCGLGLVILALVMLLRRSAGRVRPAFVLVAGLLFTFTLLMSSTAMAGLLLPRGLRLVAGYWGALAGALIGAAIMVIHGRKRSGWRYAGATFLLAAAGFWCGWAGFNGVAATCLGTGGFYRSPWTPNGDAFLWTGVASSGSLDKQRTVRWYSSDLKLERRAVLPIDAFLIAIGQEAALFYAGGKQGAQLWFVPRQAEARVIDTASYFGHYNRISPDSRRILISIRDAQWKTQAWKICDLETGTVEPVNFPAPLSEITVIALRDDGSVLWLSGSGPLDKENRPWPRANPVPESGEFPHPGKPYVVWSWKVNSADAPAQLYAAKTQWLSWAHSATTGRLNVVRVAENPPARTESVELDLTRSPPTTAAISAAESGTMRSPAEDRSFDGRFALERGSAGRFAPGWIVDTKTGRKFGMVSRATAYNDASLWWSPGAHKFLVEVPELMLAGGRWHWRHMSEEMFDTVFVVYFVDMDRQ